VVFEGLQAEGAGGEAICVVIFTTGSPAFDGGDWVAVGGAHGGRRGSSGCEAIAGGGDRSCGMGQSRFASGFVCEGGAFTALFA